MILFISAKFLMLLVMIKRSSYTLREFGIRLVCKQFQLLCLFNMHW